jgi:uncharacterized FAD-dependent dehydrogenase
MSSTGWLQRVTGNYGTDIRKFAEHQKSLIQFGEQHAKSKDRVNQLMIEVWQQSTMRTQHDKVNLRPNHIHSGVDVLDLVNQVKKALQEKPFDRLEFGTKMPPMQVSRDYRRG